MTEDLSRTVRAPKVFISYSWTSDSHVTWVEDFATRLMTSGVDVVLDRWDLKHGHDKYAFMERMVTDSNVIKVLVICDAKYAEKANDRKGGVGTESQIISPQVYEKVNQEKFIPILRERDDEGREILPLFLKQSLYIDFSDDSKFEESLEALLRNLFDSPAKPRPPLGKPPAYLFEPTNVVVKCAGTFQRLRIAVQNQRPNGPALFADYLDEFVEALEDFRIKATQENRGSFDDVVVGSIEAMRPYRDHVVLCWLFVLREMPGKAMYDLMIDFLERLIPFSSHKEGTGSFTEGDFDNYRFFLYELFLYLIAACIRARRFDVAALLMETTFHFPRTLGGNDFRKGDASQFNQHAGTLEGMRNRRLKLNLLSVTARLVRDRAPSGPISFLELLQADFLLFIRRYFPSSGAAPEWYPRCLPYAERSGAFELFARASSDRGFEPLKTLLRIEHRHQLMECLESCFANLRNVLNPDLYMNIRVSLSDLVNAEELGQITGRPIRRQ